MTCSMLETFGFACALSNHMFSMCEQSSVNNFKYKRVGSNLKYLKVVDNKGRVHVHTMNV